MRIPLNRYCRRPLQGLGDETTDLLSPVISTGATSTTEFSSLVKQLEGQTRALTELQGALAHVQAQAGGVEVLTVSTDTPITMPQADLTKLLTDLNTYFANINTTIGRNDVLGAFGQIQSAKEIITQLVQAGASDTTLQTARTEIAKADQWLVQKEAQVPVGVQREATMQKIHDYLNRQEAIRLQLQGAYERGDVNLFSKLWGTAKAYLGEVAGTIDGLLAEFGTSGNVATQQGRYLSEQDWLQIVAKNLEGRGLTLRQDAQGNIVAVEVSNGTPTRGTVTPTQLPIDTKIPTGPLPAYDGNKFVGFMMYQEAIAQGFKPILNEKGEILGYTKKKSWWPSLGGLLGGIFGTGMLTAIFSRLTDEEKNRPATISDDGSTIMTLKADGTLDNIPISALQEMFDTNSQKQIQDAFMKALQGAGSGAGMSMGTPRPFSMMVGGVSIPLIALLFLLANYGLGLKEK